MIGIGEKGYATLRVTANAPGGHSSMPPAETGVTVLAKAVLAIADDPFPLELRGPGLSMIEALAAEPGGTSKMAVANRWLFAPLLKRQPAASPPTAPASSTHLAPPDPAGRHKDRRGAW